MFLFGGVPDASAFASSNTAVVPDASSLAPCMIVPSGRAPRWSRWALSNSVPAAGSLPLRYPIALVVVMRSAAVGTVRVTPAPFLPAMESTAVLGSTTIVIRLRGGVPSR